MNTNKVELHNAGYEADYEHIERRKKNKSRVNYNQNGKYGLDYNQVALQSPSRFNQDKTQDLSRQNASQLELGSNISSNYMKESIELGQNAHNAHNVEIKPKSTFFQKVTQCCSCLK